MRKANWVTQGLRYTKESAANIVSAIRQWIFFTTYFSLPVIPATPDMLVCFLELMARTSGYEHLKHCLSSVKYLHIAQNIPFPENNFQVDATMQGLKRKLAGVAFQVLPITPSILRDIYRCLNVNKLEDLALWCSFLLSFYALLRKKSVVPGAGDHDSRKVLSRKHLVIDLQSNIIYMYSSFSKTNQFGARDLVVPIAGNSDPALDPVRHLQALFTQVQATPDSPAFTFGPGHVTYSKFTTQLKMLLSKAGYSPNHYSGHSFRRGGATFLHSCGGTALMVQASGDWTSNCFTRYLFLSTAERWKSQLLIARGIAAAA